MWLALKAIGSGIFGVLKMIPWQAWVLGAALAYGWHWHNKRIGEEVFTQVYAIRLQEQADKIADAEAAAKRKAESVAITERVRVEYVDRIKYIRGKTVEIVKEIPVYVPSDACPVHGSFRLLHDYAAVRTGPIPEPSAGADAAPVPVEDAARTVIENYGTCHETAARLIGLQDWVTQHQGIQ